METEIKLKVNGHLHEIKVDAGRTILEVLRQDLGLTGTKEGCGTGDCGACTVILDGKPVNSCLVLAVNADGSEITTVEGLTQDGRMHALQESFLKHGAFQCGFCTPGMLMSGKALLDKNPKPSELEIRQAIAGNLCRCTGYAKVVQAIQDVIS